MGCGNGNCYNVSYHPCSTNYAFSGDCNVVAEYFTNSDLPAYTARFYSQSPQEVFSDFRYDRVGVDYAGTKEMVDEVRGLNVEIPRSITAEDGGSALPNPKAIIPLPKNEISEDVRNEIARAQEETLGKELIMREMFVEEMILRRMVKREVIIRDKGSKDGSSKPKRNIIDLD